MFLQKISLAIALASATASERDRRQRKTLGVFASRGFFSMGNHPVVVVSAVFSVGAFALLLLLFFMLL